MMVATIASTATSSMPVPSRGWLNDPYTLGHRSLERARIYVKWMSIRRGLVRRLNERDSSAAMSPAARLRRISSNALHVVRQIRPLWTAHAGTH
jgi:hypothetical protein